MGIYDRDYMQDDPGSSSPTSSNGILVARCVIAIFSGILLFVGLRAPVPLYIKLPLLVGLGFLVRLIWGLPRKFEGEKFFRMGLKSEGEGEFPRAIYYYELAAARVKMNPFLMVRLLSAYHGCDRIERAKDLIQTLDGKVFPEPVLEELEHLVEKYRGVAFEKSGNGSRMKLGNN